MKFILFILSVFLTTTLFSQEVITLKTRDSVKQNFLLKIPKHEAKAIVILFPGGNGKIKLHKEKKKWSTTNFLIRSRNHFLANDFITVSIDVPSDKRSKDGLYYNFRNSQEHLTDLTEVIKYLKTNYNKPIWLIGTSRGTESVAFIASEKSDLINGIVLTSSMSKRNSKGKTLQELFIDGIEVPTLIISHKKDACKATPPKGSIEIFKMLNDDIKKEYKVFEGGNDSGLKPCKAMSYHGYLGIEKEVVDYISNWIKSH
ncbi:MAG: hypothetical protein C0626_10350 [Arcobacter sp.]|uniref:alpha/beta hydrolase n=1 Tax=uncultured Arcobacter sp. TaxID=165434 RepID=UPI000CCA76A1|nr:hypothetical protein [uncultured Arcobacter sp.]PLY09378.1 MAG: hypothetical protein C0626_10350 [Arcobacter sp.]